MALFAGLKEEGRVLKMSVRPSKLMLKRASVIMFLVLVLGFGSSLVRLVYLQIFKGEEYRESAELEMLADSSVQALRGTIYDCNNRVLAESAGAWRVFVDPKSLYNNLNKEGEDPAKIQANVDAKRQLVASGLAKILDVDEASILEKLQKTGSGEETIKTRIELKEKNAVSSFVTENKLADCIGIKPDTKRYYPGNNLASTIIGFTNADGSGNSGLEYKYDSVLTGVPGRIISAKSGSMSAMPIEYTANYEAQKGTSLVLTVDSSIQELLENELEKAREGAQANAAYGIVMDVETGAILGMSNQEDYNLNEPYTICNEDTLAAIEEIEDEEEKNAAIGVARQAQWRNRTISDTYEPGSVFKVITLAAALEEGVVNESTSHNCVGGIQVADNYIRCHKRDGHGAQNLQQGLMNSCNPFFITIGQKLGLEKFTEYFKAFGFTEKTGIDLTGEAAPAAGYTYHKAEDMKLPQLSSYSFGQTFQVSPIQMITAISAIANGGKLMKPYVVAKQLDESGNIIKETKPTVKRQVISETTAQRVLTMMEAVVSSGTGKNAYVAGFHVAGKTGTSQKIGAGNGQYVSSFACVAPADDPKVAILITIDEPVGQINGGQIAAPVAATLVEEVMTYLSVEPEYTEEEQNLIDVAAPALTGRTVDDATEIADDENLKVRVIGNGDNVVRQIPAFGQTMPRNGVVILYTDDRAEETTTVPDFSGMSLSVARRSANDMGLNLRISGNAFSGNDILAYRQDIEPNTEVKYGTVVTVYFKAYSGVSDSIYG